MGKKRNRILYWSILIFDSKRKKYGGFNHFLDGKIFRWRYTHLSIIITKKFKFKRVHNDDKYWYDGYHNHLQIGYLIISYGT